MSEILNELQEVKKASQEQAAASNNLSQEVSGKMAEIDQKVNQTADEILQVITSNNVIIYYVDGVNGSDSNSGSSGSPFFSLNRALSVCPTGSKVTIYMKRGQRHTTLSQPISCHASFVNLMPWGLNTDLSSAFHYDETTPIIALECSLNLYGSVVFGGYKSTLIVETNERTPADGVQCWVSSNIVISRSRLILNLNNESAPIFGSHYNYVNPVKVALRDADIVRTKGYLARSGCLFSVDSATGFQYTDDVIRGATAENTPSNVPFTP
ncbi:hypothetical protein AB4186_09995 [Vibrio lentus]